MASGFPYANSADALFNPARNTAYFQGWDPAADNQNHDLLCAEMSRLAYASPEAVPKALEPSGFADGGWIDKGSTQGFVAHHTGLGLSVLAFRGTQSNSLGDLISDLDTLQKDYHRGGRVHAGFFKAYEETGAAGRAQELLENRQAVLLVTGHSLGGALATLAALDAQPANLITFGSPRVGNGQFARLFDALDVHRFVNCCDVVARIPPEKFDQAHIARLLNDFGLFSRLKLFGQPLEKITRPGFEFLARGLAKVFQGVERDNQFEHVAPPRYILRSGQVAGPIGHEAILEDQQAARADYRPSADLTGLSELVQSLKPALTGLAPGGFGRFFRDFVRGLFGLIREGPVPLRDLADHAPLNYVSALAGRQPSVEPP